LVSVSDYKEAWFCFMDGFGRIWEEPGLATSLVKAAKKASSPK
jgi:hypothetical protein